MYRLAVGKRYNTQILTQFLDKDPVANALVFRLHLAMNVLR